MRVVVFYRPVVVQFGSVLHAALAFGDFEFVVAERRAAILAGRVFVFSFECEGVRDVFVE
ncbi:hypothetical protein D3C85_1629590 [compost metagenome]